MPEGYNGLPPYYVQSSDPITPNLFLSLIGMDPIVAENFVLIDAAVGAGSSVRINGTVIPNVNFVNSATVTFSVTGSNVSATASGSSGTFPVTFPAVAGEFLNSYSAITGLFTAATPSYPVTSVFGRTGAVVAQSGDYTYAQISGTPQLAQTFAPVAGEFLTGYTAATGLFTAATPATSGGTVTSFSSGNLSPLFTTSVATPTTTPALTFALNTQTANTVFAGPTSGGPAAPTFRALVAADLPAGTGTVTSVAAGTGITATPSPITTTGTISITNTAVTPGSYTYASITVNQQGQITAAASGAAPTVTSVSNSDGTLTISPTTGAVVAILNLGNANTWTGTQTFATIAPTTVSGSVAFTGTVGFQGPTIFTGTGAEGGLWITGSLTDGSLSKGTSGQVLSSTGSAVKWITPTGTVTSVSFTGGLISVATPTTTPALTVAGTSGGIPYFSSASTWASSALLASTGVVLGGGAATAPLTNANLVYTSPNLVIGSAGGTSGGISLNGTTSGTSTIAVGGTGALTITGATTATLTSAGATAINAATGSSVEFNINSVIIGIVGVTSAHYGSGVQLGWSSTSTASTASDTGFSRISAGVVGVGTGAAGSTAGTLEATNYQVGGTANTGAGTYTAITSITVAGGIVQAISGTSDERLKDSTPYEGGLSVIEGITPVRFKYNDKGQLHTGLFGDRKYVGFLAQNVQHVLPEAITGKEMSKDGTEEYLSFDPRPVIAALVNAVKELKAELDALKERM